MDAFDDWTLKMGDVATGIAINHLNNMAADERMREQMRLEDEYKKEWFDKTNAYNSWSAQIARARAAGLNLPLLLSGGGSSSSVTSQSANQPSVGSAHSQTFPLNLSELASFGLMSSQINKNNAEAGESESRTVKTDEEAKYQQWMNNTLAPKISAAYDLENAGKAYQNAIAQVKATYVEIETLQSLGEQQIRMGEMLSNIDKLKADKALSDREREQLDIIADEIRSRIRLNDSQVALNESNARKANAEAQTFEDTLELKKDQILSDITNVLMDIGVKENQIPKIRYETWRYINNMPTGDLNAWDIPWAILNGVVSAANGFGSDIGVPDVDDKISKKRELLLKSLRKKYNYNE